MVLQGNSFRQRQAALLRIAIVIVVILCYNIMQATKEVQKFASLSAKMNPEKSVICFNFSMGNERMGEFFSPNYPNNYPNNSDCERVIKAPHGHQISIEFRDQFHLEEATNCEYDYLEIRDGAYGYSNPIAKLCGHDFPRDINSNDRYLFLRFVSDDSIEYSGFRAVYSFKKLPTERPEPPRECRFNKTGVSGVITHSEIPAELSNYSVSQEISIDCMWNITVQPGYKMYLNFKEYRLNNPNNCELNYIDVYGDKLSDLGRKQRFCGTQADSVRSDGNHMNIRFFARPEALTNNLQFEIVFTAFREIPHKEKCRSNEFDCEDSTCIDHTLKCNGYDDCKYRYDEDKQQTCAPSNKGVLNLTSQHMVVILIVFCALVLGMCASITISCWSKIQERRQRKRDYKLRRSRETSVEVGLDRTMTITSLDRDRGALEHEIAAQASVLGSVPRTRKILTANTINRKGFRDDEENGCYVPEVDLSVFRKQPNGGPTQLLEDNFSPETPPHLSGNTISPDCTYYHIHHQQRDSIRSGSESPIPPPPPPPVLSHMRTRQRTLPLDASKLDTTSPKDNHLHGQPHGQSQPQIHHPDCAQHNSNNPDFSLRTKPEYSRSASVPLGPHVSVIDGNDPNNDDENEFCEDDTIVPLSVRPHRFRAEAVIEMGSGPLSGTSHSRQRSFETTRSAPDVVIMR